jgi:hypothetical protein
MAYEQLKQVAHDIATSPKTAIIVGPPTATAGALEWFEVARNIGTLTTMLLGATVSALAIARMLYDWKIQKIKDHKELYGRREEDQEND